MNQIYYFRYFLFFPFPLDVVEVFFCSALNGNSIFIVIIEFFCKQITNIKIKKHKDAKKGAG